MTPELFKKAGAALFGERWHHPLAEALGVNPRSIQRFASGSRDIPDRFRSELIQLLENKGGEIGLIIKELEDKK
tara:strand:- start:375 stop:596 length:222 start_codon:yes stop_codon:yes gene_type:complete